MLSFPEKSLIFRGRCWSEATTILIIVYSINDSTVLGYRRKSGKK